MSAERDPIVTPVEGETARVIRGRYRLVGELGKGAAGVVWRAEDQFAGGTVAVKTIRRGMLSSEPRVRREIAALRLLRLPGVVTLRDEVTEGDETHLVMELIEGTPFPGRDREGSWERIAPVVRAMLETLGRVHAAGVVHRDLKPANVLVDDEGHVTLVDFGLSYGPALGGAVTEVGAMVGTPEYLAPEQIRGRGIDGRTDLYALGVMLYEALSGVLPIQATEFGVLLRRKLSGSTIPLARVAESTPRDVAVVIDKMLAVEPADRPQSAGEALRLLFGEGVQSPTERRMPRLGSTQPLEQVLAALEARRSIEVFGRVGSGRSRLLQDAAEAAEAAGRRVRWVRVGSGPYASLAPLIGGFDGLDKMSQDDAFRTLDARLRAALERGEVFAVDDPKNVDPWSQRALDRCRDAGSIVRVVDRHRPDCVVLSALTAESLRPIFAGPSRILHLPEDAAGELWRRTGGQPANVCSEISAWVRHGFAHWDGDVVRIDRAALSRLAGGLPVGGSLLPGAKLAGTRSPELEEVLAWTALAWPHGTFELLAKVAGRPGWILEPELALLVEDGLLRRLEDGRLQPLVVPEVLQTWTDERRQAAHRALADALPLGAPHRLRHLAAAGDPEEVIAESLALGRRMVRAGNTSEALAAFGVGLESARLHSDAVAHQDVLTAYVRACLSADTPDTVNQALYEMGRAPAVSAELRALREFLLAVLETHGGHPEHAMDMLDACPPFDDEVLELWRQSRRAQISERLPIERQQAVLDDIGAWARSTGNPRALANHRVWSASIRRRQQRHAEAAELELEGLDGETPVVRAVGLLNAGSNFLEAGRRDAAAAAAQQALEIARSARHALFEAYAEALARDVAYRSGALREPDLDLVSAVAAVGSPAIEACVLATEAAVAWRAGRRELALDLSRRSGAIWEAAGYRAPFLISRGLQVECGNPLSAQDAEALVAEAASEPDYFAACQFLGLATPHLGQQREHACEVLREVAARVPAALRGDVREAISVREALERAGLDDTSN